MSKPVKIKKSLSLIQKIFLFTNLFVVILVGYNYILQLKELKNIQLEIDAAEKQKSEYVVQINELSKELKKAREPEFMEKKARENLKMVKYGERVYIDSKEKIK